MYIVYIFSFQNNGLSNGNFPLGLFPFRLLFDLSHLVYSHFVYCWIFNNSHFVYLMKYYEIEVYNIIWIKIIVY